MSGPARAARPGCVAVLCVLALAAPARAGAVVTTDGQVRRGSASFDEKEGTIRVGRYRVPTAEAYLAEDDDGRLLYAPDLEARLRGYEFLANDHLADEYVRLVRSALRFDDVALARTALERAESAGLATREAVKLRLRIDEEKSGGRADRLHDELRELDLFLPRLLVERARVALDGGTDGLRLLRAALQRAPQAPAALALLEEVAPESFPLGDARTWLDWHLDLLHADARLAESHALLDGARVAWRRDLHAIHAEPILMLTPVRDSALVGRCLAFGRLGCSALATLFATDAPARASSRPMPVFLFENKEEYQTRSGTGRRVEDPVMLQWTAGYYSPHDGISRFYWTSDPDAERRLVGTLVHELTHHWLEERNPRVAKTPPVRAAQPGYWIVEGFATFMEEGLYDVETGRWDLANPRARSLDVLASVDRRALIDWARFYALNQGGFAMLPVENRIEVAMRWQLRPTIISTRRLFYEQAGATCQFLYHGEEGRHREKLIRYVCDYYAGRVDRLDARTAFGMSAADLGRKTVSFARAR